MLDDYVKTADWKNEKHVPVIDCPDSVAAGEAFDLSVTVGKAVPHPNTTEHHIAWIAVHFVPEGGQSSFEVARCEFSAHGQSAAGANEGPAFTGSKLATALTLKQPGTLFATSYCNIHGLWETSAAVSLS